MALSSARFEITLSADGAVTSAKGLDAALRSAFKKIAPDEEWPGGDDEAEDASASALEFQDYFAPAPAAPHAPGVEWKSDRTFALGLSEREFAVTSVLSLPDPARVLIASTYVWKPHPTDEGPGIRTSGGGPVTDLYSRADGLPLRCEKRIHVRRDEKAPLSHTRRTIVIERLAADGKPVVPADAPPAPAQPAPHDPSRK